ncbi:L-threonylcarbamoyladenylate synthase [Streptomyces sp. CBMA123]|uniref:L-threonylcarbamoyladenylate synthase n=1 Tax=Streptomyces sp. CBMA123 TaxID=1896313 RepID=UPI001661E489|nr:L-threonylcarbamoyladenylate synthase [Streptomyces sp. CBMA123]MBD0692088.1 threonylcarbamoyl-AMP synthase [Streptomyces sp. CBMA123]
MSRRFDCSVAAERAMGLGEAVSAVRRGEIVVLPTDTVYGLGADAFGPEAVARLLDAKGRGRNMPSPVLVGSPDDLDALVDDLPQRARDLMQAFWPGGLTLVARHKPSLRWDLGETHGTVAVRMPAHPVALDLLMATGPLAVSSANLTGKPSPQDCDAAQGMLGEAVAVYLDAGPTPAAVPSSIVDITGTAPVLLRAGAISAERLREVVPDLAER